MVAGDSQGELSLFMTDAATNKMSQVTFGAHNDTKGTNAFVLKVLVLPNSTQLVSLDNLGRMRLWTQ